MPPKRRKLSSNSECSGDLKDSKCKTSSEDEEMYPVNMKTEASDQALCGTVTETMDCNATDIANMNATNTAQQQNLSPDAKAKDDALKPTRISKRLIIKRSRYADEEEAKEKAPPKAPRQATPRKPKASGGRQGKQTDSKGNARKVPKSCLWSALEKRHFFLGLQQFGKNFKAISKKISHAAKVRELTQRDEVQVRYFYCRTWKKISKFVDMRGAEVPLSVQELYGLVNYGMLMKYTNVNDRHFTKNLNDLIHTGETTVSRKDGRKVRFFKLRTPVCESLKKINRIIDMDEHCKESSMKLPQSVLLEITPRNSRAWAKVQTASQNPRLRMKIGASRTVESVIKFLAKKWKTHRVKSREKLGSTEESKENLVFFLHPSAKIYPVTLVAHQRQKIDISLESYREKVLPLVKAEMAANEKKPRPAKDVDKATSAGSDKSKDKSACVQEVENPAVPSAADGQNPLPGITGLQAQLEADLCSDSKEEKDPLANLLHLMSAGHSTPDGPDSGKPGNVEGSESGLSHTSSIFLQDENAVFPDSSLPFSSSSTCSTCTTNERPPSPLVTDQEQAPDLADQLPVTSSPQLAKKKRSAGGRISKKPTSGSESKASSSNPPSLCVDSSSGADNSASLDSPTPTAKSSDCSGTPPSALQAQRVRAPDVKDEAMQNEVERLTRLVTEEGLTTLNSATVTLWQLSLLLGREDRVRMQYEWRERRVLRPGQSLSGVLGQAATQMSNLLRRLCNLATLELTDFVRDPEGKSSKSASAKCVAAAGTSKSSNASAMRTRSQSGSVDTAEKAEATINLREISTQTDPPPAPPPAKKPLAVRPNTAIQVPATMQMLPQGSLMTAGGRTFVAAPPLAGSSRMNCGEPVFRVPLIPAFRDPVREQMRLEEQKTAKSILEQGPNQRRLLKKQRRIVNKKKKTPAVIVQRTLMPKLDNGDVVTYIQPHQQVPVSTSNSVMYNMTPAEVSVPSQQIAVAQSPSNTSGGDNGRPDLLQQAAMHAELNLMASPEKSQLSQMEVAPDVNHVTDENRTFGPQPLSEEGPSTVIALGSNSRDSSGDVTPGSTSMSNSSFSGFDISLTGLPIIATSDAGEKIFERVLHSDQGQGFTGLLSTPKKSSSVSATQTTSSTTVSTTTYDPSVLRTPTHLNTNVSVGLVTPIKLDLDQEWGTPMAAGDISLTAILGDASSSFKQEAAAARSSAETTPPPGGLSSHLIVHTDDLDHTFVQVASNSLYTANSEHDAEGDISLSAILGDSSSFRQEAASARSSAETTLPPSGGCSQIVVHGDSLDSVPVAIDTASSDSFGKSNHMVNLSFSSLLGDPYFRKESDSNLSPPLDPPACSVTHLTGEVVEEVAGQGSVTTTAASESSQLFNEVSQDSFAAKLDVQAGIATQLINETTQDLMSKFEALAAGVSVGVTSSQTHADTSSQLTVVCRDGQVDSHISSLKSPSAR